MMNELRFTVRWMTGLWLLASACALAAPAPHFRDATAELGLTLKNAAACWADFDDDGWPDLCAGGEVWRNETGKRFTRIAQGLGNVVAADFDNDGRTDLFSWSQRRCYRNKEGGSFASVAMPEMPASVSRGACWGDFDNDGYVDLYVGGYERWKEQITYPDLILHNELGKGFRVIWSERRWRARGVTACDFDEDGDLDVYVSNYRLMPNVLWVNDGSGRFTDEATARHAAATSAGFRGGHSIGSAWGDFDDDGHIDLFAGNFAHRDSRGDQPKSRFLHSQGPDKGFVFEDRGTCGVHYQESYATPAAGDFDGDGDMDLFFTTVYGTASFGKKNYPTLFRNQGGFRFVDVSEEAGLSRLPPTYQAAWADFDRDGDLDLVTAGKLFVNEGASGHWLEVRLHGDGQTVNADAIGAQVRVRVGERVLTRSVEAGTGEGNQNDLTLHFAFGQASAPRDIEILWPGARRQTVTVPGVDRCVTVTYLGRLR